LQTGTSMSDAISALEILNENCGPRFQIDQGELGPPLFNVQVVSERGESVKFMNGIVLYPSHSISEAKPDIILVPALGTELMQPWKEIRCMWTGSVDPTNPDATWRVCVLAPSCLLLLDSWTESEQLPIGFSPMSSGEDSLVLTSNSNR